MIVPPEPEHALGTLRFAMPAVFEAYAMRVADGRQQHDRANGYANHNAGVLPDDVIDLGGTRGEVAICYAWGLDPERYVTVRDGGLDEPDVANVDVRARLAKPNGDLPIYEADIKKRPGRAHVLVIVPREVDGEYLVPGWVFNYQAKRSTYWAPEFRNPCFAVPQAHLADPAWLPIERP